MGAKEVQGSDSPVDIGRAGPDLSAPPGQALEAPSLQWSAPRGLCSHARQRFGLQGLRHPRRRRQDDRRTIRGAARPRLRQRGAGGRRPRRRRRARRPRLRRVVAGGARPRPRVDRARRRRPRRGDDADAVLRRRHARSATLHERRPGDRQPQPEGLQRLQDGRRRTGDPRRGHPAPAPADRVRGLRARAGTRRDDGHRAGIPRPHRRRLPAGAADDGRGRFRQRHRRRVGAGNPARARLHRARAVLRGRRRVPQPPPRPEQAREPRRARARRAERRRRARPRVRRRRRPPRRRHQERQHRLSRPPADAVRTRRAPAPARRDDPLRRQVLAADRAPDPRCRRRADDVEDGPLAHQGQDARGRRAARRRDERPHLLRRALVRFRRRHLHGGAPARDRQRERRPERGARRVADELLDSRAQRRLRRRRASRGRRPPARRGDLPRRARRSSRSTACASSTTTASASCGRRTRRRCWCCASRERRRRRSPRIEADCMAALRAVKPDAEVQAASH